MADQDISEQVVTKDIRGDVSTGKFREHIATKTVGKHVVATKNRVDLPTELRARIRHTLKTRHARQGTLTAQVEDRLKKGGARLYEVLEKRPVAGSLLLGGSGLFAAIALGGAELTLGLLLGYSAYQVLREGVPPGQAAERVFDELEHGA